MTNPQVIPSNVNPQPSVQSDDASLQSGSSPTDEKPSAMFAPNVYQGQERFDFLRDKAASMSSRTKTKTGKKMEYSTVLWAAKQDNTKVCKPPLTDAELTQIVKTEWEQADKKRAETRQFLQDDAKLWGDGENATPAPICDDPDSDFNYLVLANPNQEDSEGLFPPGVSVVGGPSGAGKTTWIIQFFLAWAKGYKVFGRTVCPKKFQFITFDRRKGSLRRSLRRMRLSENIFPRKPISPPDGMPLKQVIERLWKDDPTSKEVRVFVVEGIDMNIPKFGDAGEIKKYLAELQAFCEQHTLWIIGTMGSPKAKPGEQYAAPRERLLGTTVWGRMIETIVFIQPQGAENPDTIRELHLLPRDGKSEKYQFQFERGRLVQAPEKKKGDLLTLVRDWLQTNQKPGDTFSLDNVASALNAKKSSIQNPIETLEKLGSVKKIKHGLYEYQGGSARARSESAAERQAPKSAQQKFDEWLAAAPYDKNFTFEEIRTAIGVNNVATITNLLARAAAGKELERTDTGDRSRHDKNSTYRRLRPEEVAAEANSRASASVANGVELDSAA